MAYIPNVVILGRSSITIDNEYVKNIISSVDPNGVPKEFIHRVFVIDDFDNKYLVPEKFYSSGIKYESLYKSLDRIKTDKPIKTIEIVIDLESVQTRLDIETNEIFSNLDS